MEKLSGYIMHLSRDKNMKKILGDKEYKLTKHKNICHRLCRSILSQQLSIKVADVIHKRFLDLLKSNDPTPEIVLSVKPEQLRSIGLSNAKAGYVQNVARFALEKGMDLNMLNKMSNDEIIEYLTQIKGVGRWTVEMLLIFSLGREDVFAVDDLGIQNSMVKHFQLNYESKKLLKEQMIKISDKWIPYRTYACLHLWGWKDT